MLLRLLERGAEHAVLDGGVPPANLVQLTALELGVHLPKQRLGPLAELVEASLQRFLDRFEAPE
jgi:hypothetical protein